MAAPGLLLGSPIDCLSVCQHADSCDLLVTGHTNFTGRYWTGSISALSLSKHGKQASLSPEFAKADLRAGVAAVDWLNKADESTGTPVIVSGSDDGSIDLWQYSASEPSSSLRHLEGKPAHNHIVSSVSTSSQGGRLASSSWDRQIHVWDTLAFLECSTTLTGHLDLIHSVFWAPDSEVVTSASQDKSVRQWDVRSGDCSAVMWVQQPVYTAAVSHSGHLVAAGDEGGALTLFDLRKAAVQVACLQNLHHDSVRAVAFPQQKESSTLVASTGDDGRICIIPSGPSISAVKQQVRTPHKDGAYIRGLAFGGFGLYSAAWDGSLASQLTSS